MTQILITLVVLLIAIIADDNHQLALQRNIIAVLHTIPKDINGIWYSKELGRHIITRKRDSMITIAKTQNNGDNAVEHQPALTEPNEIIFCSRSARSQFYIGHLWGHNAIITYIYVESKDYILVYSLTKSYYWKVFKRLTSDKIITIFNKNNEMLLTTLTRST